MRKSTYYTLKSNPKKFLDFNGIRTHGLCGSAAVLYQLSYENQYLGSRPICWVRLNQWMEWNNEGDVKCGNTDLNEDMVVAEVITI